MHDLATIKRFNRNPSARNAQDKPAPQPTRRESSQYHAAARAALDDFRWSTMQSPAMERELLESE